MKISDVFYDEMKRFQEERAANNAELAETMVKSKIYEGSWFYREKMEKAQSKHDAVEARLKTEYQNVLITLIGKMRNVNRNRKLDPPTAEESNMILALQNRSRLTLADIEQAAQIVSGNLFCLSQLDDLAEKHRLYGEDAYGNPMRGLSFKSMYTGTPEADTKFIENTLNVLQSRGAKFIESDVSEGAAAAMRYREEHYGLKTTEALPKRALFQTKAECYEMLTGMDTDALTLFYRAIDSSEE